MQTVTTAVIGALVAVVVGVLATWITRPQWTHHHPGRVVASIVALVVLGSVVGIVGTAGPSAAEPIAGPPTATGSATTTAPATAPPAGSTTAARPAPATESRLALVTVEPVESNSREAYAASYQAGKVANVNGVSYPRAIQMSANGTSCNNYAGGTYWIEYNIDRRWKTFTATVGLTDESSRAAEVTFTVAGDGQELATGQLRVGAPTEVDVPVGGVLRLRLQMHNAAAANGAPCRDNSHLAEVAWGDPTLS
jgi:hypothetical protein